MLLWGQLNTPSATYDDQLTLAVVFSDLKVAYAKKAGYGATSSDWTAEELIAIESDVNSGYRQFLHPPPVAGRSGSYEWSFLRPSTTIVAWASVAVDSSVTADGVYSSTTNITTVTASTAKFFPTMVGKNIVLTGVNTFEIHGYTSSTVITILGDATASSVTFSIASNGNYDLPLDFGGIDGPLTYGVDEGYIPVEISSEGQIRALRQRNTSASKPWMAAIRPKVSHSGASVQRFELLLEPSPDSDYTFGYRYVANARKLTESNPHPLGCDQQVHAEALLASVMAVAESRLDDERGVKHAEFIERITAAIAHDERASTPETLGYNADRSGGIGFDSQRDFISANSGYLVGYNGAFFP